MLASRPDTDGSRDSNSGIAAPRIAARIDALSWRTFASWHAATGRSERGALPIGNPIAPGPPPASHGRRTVSVRNPKELGLAGGRAKSLGVERSVDGPAKPGVRLDDGIAYLGSGPARRSPVRRAIVEPCSAALNHLAQRASVGSTRSNLGSIDFGVVGPRHPPTLAVPRYVRSST